jgi:hypothetical protein
MKSLLFIVLSLCFVSCAPSEKEKKEFAKNTAHSFQNPDKIGTLSDGRGVYRITVDNQYYDHYIYFIKGSPEITVNWTVQQGKTSVNQVNAILE